jgi:hypothetical protein
MKQKLLLIEIIEKAKNSDAKQFTEFLDMNKIEWEMLECNIMDYNDEFFNISLPDYDDESIEYYNGKFHEMPY